MIYSQSLDEAEKDQQPVSGDAELVRLRPARHSVSRARQAAACPPVRLSQLPRSWTRLADELALPRRNLQRLSSPDGPAAGETMFDGHDISFFDDLDALPSLFQTTNTETSGELLIDFFRYFSKEFNFTHQVVSIRSDKGVLPKLQKGWHVDFEFDPELTVRDQHKLCVEVCCFARRISLPAQSDLTLSHSTQDPFQLDYNVARTVTRDGLYTVRRSTLFCTTSSC